MAGAAWVAPSIISATAAAAATGDPEPCTPCGSLLVNVTGCINGVGNLVLTVTPSSGPPQVRVFPASTPTPAGFLFSSLCAGSATVTLTSGGQDICSSPQQTSITCGGQPPLVTLTCPC